METQSKITTTRSSTSSVKGENSLVRGYLVAYNVSQMLGWTVLMIMMISHLIYKQDTRDLYPVIAPLLQIFQTAAILEVLHSLTGLVRSNWVLTAFQVYSRVFLVWGIVWSVPESQKGGPMVMFLFAWAVTEIIRYAFYFFSLLPGPVPSLLVWCRYTFFIILYPIGVTGELMTIFAAMPSVKSSQLYSFDMPNKLNMSFSYYHYLWVIVVSYIPVFPQLYLHMFSQRKKVLGLSPDKKTN